MNPLITNKGHLRNVHNMRQSASNVGAVIIRGMSD